MLSSPYKKILRQYTVVSNNPYKDWKGPCKWRIFGQCKCGNFGSAVRLDSKPRSRDNTGRCMHGHKTRTCTCTNQTCFPERTNTSGAGSRKRKWNRFQVGTFMFLQKQKREEKVKQAEKIRLQDSAIAEKENELRAKSAKLQRLETKVL